MAKQTSKSSKTDKQKKKAPNRLMQFLRDARAEIRRVIWPTPAETRNLTALVILLSVALGLLMGFFDWAFSKLYQLLAGVF
ncbi:MAG: preprotein translocase subunit SecE [Chloroflexia bacterium]|nr:preprotein translocase subunit SecE [Chloroflexia bacterium]